MGRSFVSSVFGLSWKVPHLLQNCFLLSLCEFYAKGNQRPGLTQRPEKGGSGQRAPPGLGPLQVGGVNLCSLAPTALSRGLKDRGRAPQAETALAPTGLPGMPRLYGKSGTLGETWVQIPILLVTWPVFLTSPCLCFSVCKMGPLLVIWKE